jgi:hypothetical protein
MDNFNEYIMDAHRLLQANLNGSCPSNTRKAFIDTDNIKLIVISIVKGIKNKLNYNLSLNNIPANSIALYMNEIFYSNSQDNDETLKENVFNMNKLVSKKCLKSIIGEINNYNWATSNLDENGYPIQPGPIDRPNSTYSSQQLHNPYVMENTSTHLFTGEKLNNDYPIMDLKIPECGGNRGNYCDNTDYFNEYVAYNPAKIGNPKLWTV